MLQPNVVLAPRNVYEDIKNKRIQPDVLFYATIMIHEPEITARELEERYGARLDEVIYLFEYESNNESEVAGNPATPEQTTQETVSKNWNDEAQTLFTEIFGRDPGIRPHQYEEIETRTNGDLGIIQSLAEIAAKAERKNGEIRFVDKFVFKVLSTTPLDRLRPYQPKKSKIATKVQQVLDSIPPPPEETEPREGLTPEMKEKLREMSLR